jgi:hypothetical protein
MTNLSLSRSLIALLAASLLAACQEQAGPGRLESRLTADDCMTSAASGKDAVCHWDADGLAYARIVIAEQACLAAHSQNHPADFIDTTGDCSCVGDGQGCQAAAPCCSGLCDVTGACAEPSEAACQSILQVTGDFPSACKEYSTAACQAFIQANPNADFPSACKEYSTAACQAFIQANPNADFPAACKEYTP